MAERGYLVEQRDHLAGALRLGVDRRRVLRIDQHEVRTAGLDAADAVLDHLGGLAGIEIAQHRIGPDLPDHEVRLGVDDLGLQPRHHLGCVFAALAAIQHRDVGVGIGALQLRRQPVRIGKFRRRRAIALGGGRAEGHDHHRLAKRQLASDMRHRAHGLRPALRRAAGHAAEYVGRRLCDFLDLVDRFGSDAFFRRVGLIGRDRRRGRAFGQHGRQRGRQQKREHDERGNRATGEMA